MSAPSSIMFRAGAIAKTFEYSHEIRQERISW